MNGPVTYVRSRGPPRRVARRKRLARSVPASSRRRQLAGLALARRCSAAADAAPRRASTTGSRSRARCCSTCSRSCRRRGRRHRGRARVGDRRGAAHQLLLRRAGAHADGRPRPTRCSRSSSSSSSRRSSAARSNSPSRRARTPSARAPRPRRCRPRRAGARRARVAARDPRARARHASGWSRSRSRSRASGSGEWVDAEHAGWAPAGRRGTAAFRYRRSGRALRLVGPRTGALRRGPAGARGVRRGRADRVRGRRPERQGARRAGACRRSTTSAPRCWPRSATTCARHWPGSRRPSARLRQTDVEWSDAERRELLATIEESTDRLDAIVAEPARRQPPGGRRARRRSRAPVALDEVDGRRAAGSARRDAGGSMSTCPRICRSCRPTAACSSGCW